MQTNIDVAKQVLKDVLGLSPGTMDKVIRQIQASGDTSQIQTNKIRMRMGASSMNQLTRGLDAASSRAGGEDVGGEGDAENQMDLESEWDDNSGQEQSPNKYDTDAGMEDPFGMEKKETRESIQFSLKDYLINEENMVSLDLSNPADATAEVRKMSRIAQNSPDRLRKQQMQDVRDEKSEAQDAEGPTKTLQMQIANTKQRLVMLNKKLADLQKREGGVQ